MIIRILSFVGLAAMFYFSVQYLWVTEPPQISGKAMVAVNLPTLSGAAKEGEGAYNNNCASCHGKDAAGQDGVAPPLIHKIYEPSHHGDVAFVLAAKNGVRQHHWRFGDMPPVTGASDAQMTMIIQYVRTLQRFNGIQ